MYLLGGDHADACLVEHLVLLLLRGLAQVVLRAVRAQGHVAQLAEHVRRQGAVRHVPVLLGRLLRTVRILGVVGVPDGGVAVHVLPVGVGEEHVLLVHLQSPLLHLAQVPHGVGHVGPLPG
uniref:Putative secreted protein n=1 Tax=Ixodes ricinus TaxID=34613 RepID=A0A6B0UMS9_IXORI